MRVALFTDTYDPQINGVSRTLARLVRHLHERGHAVALVTPGDQREQDPDPAAALHIRMSGWSLPFYPQLCLPRWLSSGAAQQLRAFAPDLVHVATEFTLGWSGLQWAQQRDVPVVSSFHTDFAAYVSAYGVAGLEAFTWRYLRAFHARARLTLCPSQATREQLRQAGFSGELRIWSRGVDAVRFSPQHASPALREQWADTGNPIVLCVSRAAPEKRLDLLLAAFQLVRAEFPLATLVMVGDGPALSALRESAGPGVHFTGSLSGPALAAAYASADVFAFPSDTETFGNVVLEAAASGLPLIAADRGGVTDTVIPGWTGLRFPAGDGAGLADCIGTVLRDSELRVRLGRNARAWAMQRGWDRILDGVIDAYGAVCEARTSRVA